MLLGVNSDKDIETARKYVKKKDINWRSFWAGEDGTRGSIPVKWNISSWPSTFVIDVKGVIRYKNLRGDELDQAITKLLAEAGHEVDIKHDEVEEKEVEEKVEEKKKDD